MDIADVVPTRAHPAVQKSNGPAHFSFSFFIFLKIHPELSICAVCSFFGRTDVLERAPRGTRLALKFFSLERDHIERPVIIKMSLKCPMRVLKMSEGIGRVSYSLILNKIKKLSD